MSPGTLTGARSDIRSTTAGGWEDERARPVGGYPVGLGSISADAISDEQLIGVVPEIVLINETIVEKYAHRHRIANWAEEYSRTIERNPVGIWDTDKLQQMLKEPVGSPIELTKEEAAEIVRLAFGRRSDLEPGNAFVEKEREMLGASMIDRLKDVEGQ